METISPYAIPGLALPRKQQLTLSFIENVVCRYYHISGDVLQNQSRIREVVKHRQICHYFGKEYDVASLSVIGRYFGGKDHATVLHSHKTCNNLCETDKQFNAELSTIRALIEKRTITTDAITIKHLSNN